MVLSDTRRRMGARTPNWWCLGVQLDLWFSPSMRVADDPTKHTFLRQLAVANARSEPPLLKQCGARLAVPLSFLGSRGLQGLMATARVSGQGAHLAKLVTIG